MLFAAADYDVCLYDIEEKQLSGALTDIQAQIKELEGLKLLRGTLSGKEQFNNIRTTSSLEDCVKDAVYIHVSISKNKKKHYFGQITCKKFQLMKQKVEILYKN